MIQLATILSAASGFLGSKNGIIAIAGAAAVGGWIMWYFEDQAHTTTSENAAARIAAAEQVTQTLRDNLSAANQSIDALRLSELENYKRQIADEYELALMKTERDQAILKLNTYEERWSNVATKKPGLVARLINRATDKRVQSITTTTCGKSCDKDGSGDKSSKSGDNANAGTTS